MVAGASRVVTAMALIAAWLILLFTGWTLGGAVHLLLLASLVVFPWSGAGGRAQR